jgi:hypothetical protein
MKPKIDKQSQQAIREIQVRILLPSEQVRYDKLMSEHHYLGSLVKIGECLRYVATWNGQWVSLLSISAAALKCGVRDKWIGWDFRSQYGRLPLIANNSRFLILPDWHLPNLGSRVLSLTERRVVADWVKHFGHPLLLLETFVDPRKFHGGVYRAANWQELGMTRGFRRTSKGYSAAHNEPKMVFIRPLHRDCRALLTHPDRSLFQLKGENKMSLNANQMRSLPDFFKDIPDPRRKEGRRYQLHVILAMAAAATLCGMRGYKDISTWVNKLGQQGLARFGCRRKNGRYEIPCSNVIRYCIMSVDPQALDRAIQDWLKVWGIKDQCLAMDGKTMKSSRDESGNQTHIMSLIGHDTKSCYAQKK